jgi:hypothetical protein
MVSSNQLKLLRQILSEWAINANTYMILQNMTIVLLGTEGLVNPKVREQKRLLIQKTSN